MRAQYPLPHGPPTTKALCQPPPPPNHTHRQSSFQKGWAAGELSHDIWFLRKLPHCVNNWNKALGEAMGLVGDVGS